MHILSAFLNGTLASMPLMGPLLALVQEQSAATAAGMSLLEILGILVGFLVVCILLTRVWVGIINVSLLDVEPLSSIERRQPYLPRSRTIIVGILATLALVLVSFQTMGSLAAFQGEGGHLRAYALLVGIASMSMALFFVWHKAKEHLFAFIIGTAMSFILISFTLQLLGSGTNDPFLVALSVMAVVLIWRFLFGPWEPHAKATLLATFLFWVAFQILAVESPPDRIAHLVAIGIAAVPAFIWCALFLPYHRERLSIVFLMFFSGMASTVPILFYDALVKRGIELQFFVFRIVPENFNATVQSALHSSAGGSSLQISLLSLFITFLFVGLLEEGSKYWVLRRNGSPFFTSIDDAMQLAILVAIGFAFAENITQTGYFVTFVKEFLWNGQAADWASFLGNVAGRSILTSMVHIVSTGLLGFFVGRALFHDPNLLAMEKSGQRFWVSESVHWLVGIRRQSSYRTEMLTIGLVLAVFLHALSNFLVTLPDALPGNPRTFGDLFGSPSGSPLHYVALLLIPALLYVVGGFWLLTSLFGRKDNMKERGHVLATEVFVIAE
jgi:hypothetical protein